MADPIVLIVIASLIGPGIVAMTVLTVWQGWFQLKLRELDRHGRPEPDTGFSGGMNTRIELADVRERLRKLEAIAAGVDL